MNTLRNFALIIASTMFLAAPVLALELQAAKKQGLVGEMANGYLGSPKSSPAGEVKALISDINNKRKAKYKEVAGKQGVALSAIEKLAGEKAFSKTRGGNYIKPAGGSWQKK